MLHSQLAALVMIAAALVVAGCGGSSKTTSSAEATTSAADTSAQSTTSTQSSPATIGGAEIKIQSGKPLSHTVWVAKGDAICARTNAELSATTVKTTQDMARVLPQAAAYDLAEATELSKLVPPAAMAADWKQIVIGFQKFGEFSSKAAGYLKINDYSGAQPDILAGTAVQKETTHIAERDGFKECSQL